MQIRNCLHTRGFTLIELSIVLVIIGLIVGGVLAGRDLIEVAKARKSISQMTEFSLGINNFKLKYNALPGDISYAKSQAVGANTYAATIWGTGNTGNDNGRLECNGGRVLELPNKIVYQTCDNGGEFNLVARELFLTNMYGGGPYATPNTYGCCEITTQSSPIDSDQFPYPHLAFGKSINFMPVNTNIDDTVWFFIVLTTNGFVEIQAGSPTPPLTPAQAAALDSKLDDGLPKTGNVRALRYQGGGVGWMPDTQAASCVVDVTAAAYNLATDSVQCRVLVRAP